MPTPRIKKKASPAGVDATLIALDAGASSSTAYLPKGDLARLTLPVLAEAAQGCRGCELYRGATQAVFGEGPAQASLMLVGEQPGDQEDLAGRPFVGPAGGLLDRALGDAGIDRQDVYVTNAVKHFSFVQKGKRRIHQKPKGREVKACQGWLAAELEVVRPRLVVCMGATAAQSLLGPKFRLTQARGTILPPHAPGGPAFAATYHPSAILRAPDSDARAQMYRDFVADLRVAARHLRRAAAATGISPA